MEGRYIERKLPLWLEEIRKAQKKLPPEIYDHLTGAADDESTLKKNRGSFKRISFIPRCAVNVDDVSITLP